MVNDIIARDKLKLLSLQQYAANWSTDPSRRVACAVYCNDTDQCISKATNYLPDYLRVDNNMCKVTKSALFVHAERACFDNIAKLRATSLSSDNITHVTAYLTTLPCVACATMFTIHTLPISITRIVCVDNCSATFKERHQTAQALEIIKAKYDVVVYKQDSSGVFL